VSPDAAHTVDARRRAPKKLVRAAAHAAGDEVRHARATVALARRFGARPTAVNVERSALRSIEAMALENAVEGCVRAAPAIQPTNAKAPARVSQCRLLP
jgi:hypothetical protein